MKRLASIAILAAVIPAVSLAYTSPGKPQGFVSDFADVIPAAEQAIMEAKLSGLQDATGAQVAVVTVKTLEGDTVENFAVRLFEEWKIGREKEDDGLLILVSLGDREFRIEVGYGLEGTVTDLQAGIIKRDVMIPAFKEGDYAKGIGGAVDAVSAIISGSPEAAQYSREPEPGRNIDWSVIVFSSIMLLSVLARILSKSKSWWLGGVLGAAGGSILGFIFGFLPIGIISMAVLGGLGLLLDYLLSKGGGGKGPGSGMWWMGPGMGGRHGGMGGGFGGFGGGMSGGGGASGRW